MKSASSKLDDILASQRSPNDKSGLGYTGEKKTSEDASTSSQKVKVKKIQTPKSTTEKIKNSSAQPFKQSKGTQCSQNF